MKLNKKIITAISTCMLIMPSATALNQINAEPVQAAVHHRYGHVYRDHRAKYVLLRNGYIDDAVLYKYHGYQWIHNDLGHPEKDVVTNFASRSNIKDLSDLDYNIKHVKFFNSIKSADNYWNKYAKKKHFKMATHPLRIKFDLTADQWKKLSDQRVPLDEESYAQGKDAYCTKYDLDPSSMRPWKDIRAEWAKGTEGVEADW